MGLYPTNSVLVIANPCSHIIIIITMYLPITCTPTLTTYSFPYLLYSLQPHPTLPKIRRLDKYEGQLRSLQRRMSLSTVIISIYLSVVNINSAVLYDRASA